MRSRSTTSGREVFIWQCGASLAKSALERMLPYFSVKREQAEVAIRFQARKRPRGNVRKTREEVEQDILDANQILELRRA